jgi:lipopolysaccharide transport system permease protein
MRKAATAPHHDEEPLRIITARRGWRSIDLGEIWQARDLIWLFIKRDLTVRYKQTVFGLLWVVLQPLALTIVYSIFFGYIARIPSEGVPYPVFVLSGTILWQSFSRGTSEAGVSLVAQQGIISKIYFPRPIIPLTPVISTFVDCAAMLLLLVGLMLFYRMVPGETILLAPLFAVLAAALAYAIGLWLSALDAIYRDVRYVLTFLIQFWYFATPVIYPLSMVPERFRFLFLLNPLTAPIQGFRWAVTGNTAPPDGVTLASSIAMTTMLLLGGLMFFRRIERSVVDRI